MARRGGTLWYPCTWPAGCTEKGCVDWDSQRERAQLAEARKHWKCSLHRNYEQRLRPDNPARSHVLVAKRSRIAPGLYWAEEGAEYGSMGLVDGPGFRVFASDFPEGTRLHVTAYVETPEQAAIAAEVDQP
jgi:hypothetical protein